MLELPDEIQNSNFFLTIFVFCLYKNTPFIRLWKQIEHLFKQTLAQFYKLKLENMVSYIKRRVSVRFVNSFNIVGTIWQRLENV